MIIGIIFMSDGYANYPSAEISSIKTSYLPYIYKFWCIGYGDSNFDVLKRMVCELYGDETNFKNPKDKIALEVAYAELANTRDEN